ncbi:hypothetical protein Tco_0272558 [Tanacetum coccineum]
MKDGDQHIVHPALRPLYESHSQLEFENVNREPPIKNIDSGKETIVRPPLYSGYASLVADFADSYGKEVNLDFENSVLRLPTVRENNGVCSFEFDFGENQIVLDFENSTLMPSAKDDLRSLPMFDDWGWFGYDVITQSVWGNPCERFFLKYGSFASQGECSSGSFGKEKEGTQLVGVSFDLVGQKRKHSNYSGLGIKKWRISDDSSLQVLPEDAKHV